MRAARLEFDAAGKAKVGIIVTGEVIEENGRLLAYVTPWLTPPLPPRDDPRRRTFNLELIETGWAVPFIIYPSLPRDTDLNLTLHAAENAWANKLGAWHEFGTDLLLGYEHRACLKLGTPDPGPGSHRQRGSSRRSAGYASMCLPGSSSVSTATTASTRPAARSSPPRPWARSRLWIWPQDLDTAREELDLIEPEI
jgi:hypothetical protein